MHLLDGETVEVHGIGFAGVKGFAGGFGRGVLGPWGEEAIKRFVHEAVDEALKLESALARLRTATRIALLHYAPIAETVEGEPREIYPYLGCSRLEEPLSRYPVTAVFHGHAHHGQLPKARRRPARRSTTSRCRCCSRPMPEQPVRRARRGAGAARAEGADAWRPRRQEPSRSARPDPPRHVRRRRICNDPARLLSREWLVTNGLGGYAAGTLAGVITRRYHGLLIAALPAPLGRLVMVSQLGERCACRAAACTG